MKKFFELINKNLRTIPKSSLLEGPHLPLITISREKGSGGRLIAEKVIKSLGSPWIVINKQIVDAIARESRFEKELIKHVDENYIGDMEKFIDEIFGKRYMNIPTYYKHLVKILSSIGRRGYAIVVGRGINFLFPQALKIRIICEMNQRIKWMMEYEKMTENQAKKAIADSDKKRFDFVESLFHHDVKKAHHYDLVIRTSENLSIDDASEIIVRLAKRRFRI